MTASDEETAAQREMRKLTSEIDRWKWGLVTAIIGLCVIYIFWFRFYNTSSLSADPAGWGQLGDFFGGLLNPIVAFAAFYWLTRSVALQKQELAETRIELGKAAKAQNSQVEKAQVSVQIAALGQLNSVFASEIQRAEENLRHIKVEPGGNFVLKRRYFEARFDEFQQLQRKILIALTAGLRGEWNDQIDFDIPIKSFSLEINLLKSEVNIREVGMSIRYGSKYIYEAKQVGSFKGHLQYFCTTCPQDMSKWSVYVDEQFVGEFPVPRDLPDNAFNQFVEIISRKYPDLETGRLYL